MNQQAPPQPHYHQTTVVVQGPPQSQAFPAFVNLMCFPGLGQLIQGRLLAALVWWVLHVCAALSCMIGIGFIIWPIVWIACVVDAARYNPMAHNSEGGTSLAALIGVGVVGAMICIPIFLFGGLAVLASFAPDEPPAPAPPPPVVAQNTPIASETLTEPSTIQLESTDPPAPVADEIETPPAADLAAQKAEQARLEAEANAELERSLLPPAKSRDELIDEAKWRTWHAAEGGFKVEAKFLRFGAGKVTLEKRDGKVINVPIEILVEDDAAFIREQRWLKAGE